MLTVGIEGCDKGGSPEEGVIDSSLESSALAQIQAMPQNHRSCCTGGLARDVGGAIINDNDMLEHLAQFGDDVTDHLAFVVGRNDHP